VQPWHHPGGKLREVGAQALSDVELLAILISSGIRGRPAEAIAQEVIDRFGSLAGMARQPLEAFLQFKGLSDVKIIRIAAAFEIARRLMKEAARGEEKQAP
jgi:DNA repair protein RadC